MPTIEIDGQTLEVEAGTMIIEAADRAGIYIPRFCYHEKLSVAANCRMCLVEVERAPKPVPACATPVTDGMKVYTASAKAVDAQKGTMEFLLINHPLDCPVCDQGGECPLQDQAMGYGKDVSRFSEGKRVVEDKNIGPLIATEMTRCIHCTRCVRFGAEVAGIMELGATGRGEHMEIGTFLGHSVDSELSGNVIDLCPVGALTSKPYRFTARAWELAGHDAVSPHDCVGTNIEIQEVRGVVKRVLPRVNEAVNECWISDRDRFSYQAFNSAERLENPLIRVDGQWRETDWQNALEFAARGLKRVIAGHGAGQVGALISPLATLEEFFLGQRLMRSLGSQNIDHRLRQVDFRNDDSSPLYPGLGSRIVDLEDAGCVWLVGSNIRKEQPLLGLRVRHAAMHGAKVAVLNCYAHDFHFPVAYKHIVAPSNMPGVLARVLKAVAGGRPLPAEVEQWAGGDPTLPEQALARSLKNAGERGHIILGLAAQWHPEFSVIRALAQHIADRTRVHIGLTAEANGVAGWLAGCVPHRGPAGGPTFVRGRDAAAMVRDPLRGYLLLGIEPQLDSILGQQAQQAVASADFVVALSAFDTRAHSGADVLLPMATFSETPGTLVNCEGIAQTFAAAVKPRGESRPAWKILRVLGNFLELDGFDYVNTEQVGAEVSWSADADVRLTDPHVDPPTTRGEQSAIDMERVVTLPLYRADPLVRRAPALQSTADNPAPSARFNAAQASRAGVEDGTVVTAHAGEMSAQLTVTVDHRVPDRCVCIPTGWESTVALDGPGLVRIVRS